jgi:hypothetical protein
LDRARATGKGEFRCINAYPAKETLQTLSNGLVGILGIAGRDGDLGDAGVQPVAVPVVDVPRQAQQGDWLDLGNGIVSTLVGHHRGRDGDLTAPLAQLHDQREIHAPGHVVEHKVPIGIGQRRCDRLA